MTTDFNYRPRFVDIRIKPPKDEDVPPSSEERVCDWASCRSHGACRAPKGPDKLNEFYYFCPTHAAQYNKNWDFFAEMSDAQAAAFQRSAAHGHRPTWKMGSGDRLRDAATKVKKDFGQGFADPFGMFDQNGPGPKPDPTPRERKLGRLEKRAFETLGLQATADEKTVRAKYTALVKQYHPDMNGGDRTSEQRLQDVIEAYQMLKKAGLG